MLKLNDLSASYGRVQVLFNISLEVKDKSVVTLIGTNGAGKSTTLKAISRLLTSVKGSITFNGEELIGTPSDWPVKLGIVHVPEGRQLFSKMKVKENLELGAYLYAGRRTEIRERMEYVYHIFPKLADRKDQLAGTLSGGEQQMLAIGRGLMSKPKILLLDEPSWGLAPIVTQQIFDALKQLPNQGTSILLVEQNAWLALEIADYGYLIQNGSVVDSGRSSELKKQDHVREIYMGK
ncbi:ABC transporter ATP-binding protein [Paenibacillus validus]|uniref:ATP-binding cassette domain-containing protein n=1 Tax=Paenibacillus validus TaxID=44253 RepID=A0A7X3CSD8_9BACL|nr:MULTISPECIES: ABC transporter ATP-binding protein [Paenibacillus]MED4600629.1 ABC transporter ATP-binding protein [Paenibacillus validus]MED4606262.1 ABC transporter ATP-binding protein [Paenibacillus validus]MUG69912.1 ATP-binding cassette domain-containing protein [Paenibacillus validus]